jgi:serine carboxypeptidase-like clade I
MTAPRSISWTTWAVAFLLMATTSAVTTTTKTGGIRATDSSSNVESSRKDVASPSRLLCDQDMTQHPDFVPHLPGYDQPLPSPWFSGFLEYTFHGRTIHTHYILVLAQEDFKNDKPLIYWSNGGPGASSLFGLLTELGPLLFYDDNSKDIPTPHYNPYTWSQLGSLLVFDQPAPVGFSYCNDTKNATDCGGLSWTDELAAENAHAALDAFYKAFPCLQSLPLYLTGESYAGIYIPTLARSLLQDSKQIYHLKGWAVGDGCLGTETGICGMSNGELDIDVWQVLFLAGHGQMPMTTFRHIMQACRRESNENDSGNDNDNSADFVSMWPTSPASRSPECKAALDIMQRQVGGYFEYSLYDECTYDGGLLLKGALNDYPCGGNDAMIKYLNSPQVKEALHLTDAYYYSTDNADGFDYTPTEKDLRPFYTHVAKNTNMRVLIYNGDTDPAITALAAQNWTSHLGLTESQGWRPWTVDGCRKMGGYVTRYQEGLDFVTIRGAGHMVRILHSNGGEGCAGYLNFILLVFLYILIMSSRLHHTGPDLQSRCNIHVYQSVA